MFVSRRNTCKERKEEGKYQELSDKKTAHTREPGGRPFPSSDHHASGEERTDCFALTVCLMSCDSQYSVTLPHVAVGWSAVCNCGISLLILTCFLSS